MFFYKSYGTDLCNCKCLAQMVVWEYRQKLGHKLEDT